MCLAPISHRKDGRPYTTSYSCGKCFECIKKRCINWAYRVGHELASHDDNIFLTLTYDDLQADTYAYDYTDFQKFMKRLRDALPSRRIKYFTSLEYGGQNGRLHFHSILFNFHPSYLRGKITKGGTAPSGFPLYNSEAIQKLWPFGFHSFSEASVETAYYIASYALSDNTFTNDYGEILSDQLKCSQGIGLDFFIANMEIEVARAIFYKRSLPRYYKDKLEKFYPVLYRKLENHLTDLKKNFGERDDEYARIIEFEKKNSRLLFRNEKHFEFDNEKKYFRK